jgi:chorismate dehydratase
MIFGKIDFINLLPFNIFIKKNINSSQIKQIINYKESYPSKINKQFKKKQIDAAFISSIVSKNKSCLDIGIVAKKDVLSVLVLTNEKHSYDYQSDTSNVLCNILGIKGKVMIGDKALSYYYNNKNNKNHVDLALLWNKKYNLPFVFARLSFNKHKAYLQKLTSNFLSSNIKIPQYILIKYSKKTGLTPNQIKDYLKKISYKISHNEKKSLKLFFKLHKAINEQH